MYDMTDHELERLSREDPTALLDLIESGTLEPTLLTFAAEYAGISSDSTHVTRVLLPLLDHEKPYVREGALYGLARHRTADALNGLARIASTDAVSEVREIAAEALSS